MDEDIEALRQEWETSERLLAESQKDNLQKQVLLENYKQYVKELEKLVESSCGPTWRNDHQFTPLTASIPVTTASTPLPKPTPSSLRYSTSVSLSHNKKASRILNRHASQQVDLRQLRSLKDITEDSIDSTPTGAMRRLQGKGAPAAPLLPEGDAGKISMKRDDAVRILLDELEQGLVRREAYLTELAIEARTECLKLES